MKRILCLAALLLAAQDEKPCDLAKIELRSYCGACKAWPSSDQVDKGACRRCKGKVEPLETCIKVYWDCPRMHDTPKRHAVSCCPDRKCCREVPVLALVWRECGGCRARALKEKDLRHLKDGCGGSVRKVCALSEKFPHGGVEP
jgi:hypothetical protein